ncbi:MAG: hypothetical protein MHMPM18_000164 [Marteilia pararefringens]
MIAALHFLLFLACTCHTALHQHQHELLQGFDLTVLFSNSSFNNNYKFDQHLSCYEYDISFEYICEKKYKSILIVMDCNINGGNELEFLTKKWLSSQLDITILLLPPNDLSKSNIANKIPVSKQSSLLYDNNHQKNDHCKISTTFLFHNLSEISQYDDGNLFRGTLMCVNDKLDKIITHKSQQLKMKPMLHIEDNMKFSITIEKGLRDIFDCQDGRLKFMIWNLSQAPNESTLLFTFNVDKAVKESKHAQCKMRFKMIYKKISKSITLFSIYIFVFCIYIIHFNV